MHPASSIILFTVLSGLGFGMFFWLGVGALEVTGTSAFIFYAIAYVLTVGGLLFSTLHLGHPERAIKAFSQWRSSWLSREGVLAVTTLCATAIFAAALVFADARITALGWVSALLALVTVFATAMIYAQLKTVPRWNHLATPVLFVLQSLAGGALLVGQVQLAVALLLLLGLVQLGWWGLGDQRFAARASTMETATGLGHIGKVRLLESPHTGSNYLLKEMVHLVGRKHARVLRIIGVILLSPLPAGLLLLPFSHWFAAVAVLAHLVGAFACRWLFFAEAEHVVGLYYGKR